MVLLLLLHIAISLLCLFSGFLFYHFPLKGRSIIREYRPIVFYLITGLICLTLASQIIVLFFPVNEYWLLCLSILLGLTLCIPKMRFSEFVKYIFNELKKQSALQVVLIFILWILILALNAGPTIMDDTESYHIQMIKWTHEYGSVPGIVNLHNRFGFNSSWFTSVSLFIPESRQLNFYTLLNGVISAWFCSFLVSQLSPLLKKKKEKSISSLDIAIILVLLFSFYCWPMTRGNAATANYDFITTFLVLVLFIKGLQSEKGIQKNPFTIEWIIWPVYLFTVRIINYPLLLLSIYGFYCLLKNREWRRTAIVSAVSFCLVAAFIARNVILSGYPFYPSTAFNIFNVDWKADSNMIKGLLDYIKYFNRVNEMYVSIEDVGKLDFPDWVFAWFRYLFSYDKPVVIAGLSGLLLNFIFIKRFFKRQKFFLRFFIVVLGLYLISWFWIAPDPRFVYGCLLCGIMLLPVLLLRDKQLKINSSATRFFFICMIGVALTYTSLKVVRNKNYQNFWLPYRLPQPPVKEIIVDNIPLKIPEIILSNWNRRCYATDLPCLYIIDPKLRARGSSIRDGFRLEEK